MAQAFSTVRRPRSRRRSSARAASAGIVAPVEMLITKDADGAGTSLVYVRPSSLMVIDDNPPLLEAAKALDAKCEAPLASTLRTAAAASAATA